MTKPKKDIEEGDCTAGRKRGLTLEETIARYPDAMLKLAKNMQKSIKAYERDIEKFLRYLEKTKKHAVKWDNQGTSPYRVSRIHTIREIISTASEMLKIHK